MSITIRDAKKEDVEIVAWTVLTALDMDTDEMEKFIKSCSEDDSIYSWRNAIVATVDGTAVGCLIAYEGSRYKELRDKSWLQLWDDMDSEYLKTIEDETVDGEFYLDSMAILPEYRGRSIGRELMAYAIEKGKALGCVLLSWSMFINQGWRLTTRLWDLSNMARWSILAMTTSECGMQSRTDATSLSLWIRHILYVPS